MNKSTEALECQDTVFEMEVQSPYVTKDLKQRKNKIHIIGWDHTKTYTLAVFTGCFILWALVFFPLIIFKGDM